MARQLTHRTAPLPTGAQVRAVRQNAGLTQHMPPEEKALLDYLIEKHGGGTLHV